MSETGTQTGTSSKQKNLILILILMLDEGHMEHLMKSMFAETAHRLLPMYLKSKGLRCLLGLLGKTLGIAVATIS